eukprot:COSAG05_NODE_329_length_11294_cov_59.570076_6_plen_89_part_00
MQLYAKDRNDQKEWVSMLSEAFERYQKELNQQHDREGTARRPPDTRPPAASFSLGLCLVVCSLPLSLSLSLSLWPVACPSRNLRPIMP